MPSTLTTTTPTLPPSPYTELDVMPIDGQWRQGRSGQVAADTDPWSGDTLLKFRLADRSDVDAAFESAKSAQRAWAARPPVQRAGVMRAAGHIIESRQAEIVDWLVREGGGTRTKSELERLAVWSAHNPKVAGSNPAPATNENPW